MSQCSNQPFIRGPGGCELRLTLEGDLLKVPLASFAHDEHVVFALDFRAMEEVATMFRLAARLELGDRAHVTYFDADDPRRLCSDLVEPASIAARLLNAGQHVRLCACAAAGVELLAAAALLQTGHSQAEAVAAVRRGLPEAFPDNDAEIAVAVVEEAMKTAMERPVSLEELLMRMTLPERESAAGSELAPKPAVPAERNPAAVYLARLAPGSRRTMRAALDKIAGHLTSNRADALTCPWPEVRYQHAQAVRSQLAATFAPSTTNKHLAALRGVLRESWRLGLLDAEAYRRAADLETVRGTNPAAGREVSVGEFAALFRSCAEEGTASASRDAALIALLYGAGLRRSEAVSVNLGDYDASSGALVVRRGKGRKARTVYATSGVRTALDAWVSVRGDDEGPLLFPVNKGDRISVRQMTDQAVLYRLRARAAAAGVAAFTPHDCRRSFISHLLAAGADLVAIQNLAGHANVSTTARYDRRGETAKMRAVELLHVPFVAFGARHGRR